MKKYVLFFLVATAAALPLSAQSYRYIDESGNIHFVDKASDVPARYRSQLYPTPTPLNPKEWRKVQKEQEKLRKKKVKELQKEAKRLQKEKEKQAREEERAKKTKKGVASALKRTPPTPEPTVEGLSAAEGDQGASAAAAPPATPAAQ